MKELIEQVRSFEIDHTPDGWPAIRMREVSALADALEQQAKQIEELAAALAGKDAALKRLQWEDELDETACSTGIFSCPECGRFKGNPHSTDCYIGNAIALQPHAVLVAKLKADAVLEFAKWYGIAGEADEYADRIERGEVK